MSMSLDFGDLVRGIAAVSRALENEVKAAAKKTAFDVHADLVAPPPEGTPVDKGTARKGWKINLGDPVRPVVHNDEPHIRRLNDGWSQQSPAGFVDVVVDKYNR